MNARDNTPTVRSVQTALGAAIGDGYMTIQELMTTTRLKDAEVRKQLKDLNGLGRLESIPGAGRLGHRYRLPAVIAPKAVEHEDAAAVELAPAEVRCEAKDLLLPESTIARLTQERDAAAHKLAGAEAAGRMLQQVIEGKDAEIATLKRTYNQLFDAMQQEQEDAAKARAEYERVTGLLRNDLANWAAMAKVFGCTTPEEIADRISGLDTRVATFNKPLVPFKAGFAPAVGYVIHRSNKRFGSIESAQRTAKQQAKKQGQARKVFALVPVGVAVPGAEWKAA